MDENWYAVKNIDQIDSPALIIYPDRIKENIRILKNFVPDTNRLRPHIKTNKCAEVAKLLLDAGIKKYKCATIAEAEMLAEAGARDVLLAYQPVGPKALRLVELIKKNSGTQFSCLTDNKKTADNLAQIFEKEDLNLKVYLDLNIGMNRTGIVPEKALELYLYYKQLKSITPVGLHAYDGHIRDADLEIRTRNCNENFQKVESLQNEIIKATGDQPVVIAGGTPTFPIHAKRSNVECSPGTFIFWDKGYQSILAEQPFLFAALVVTRVISLPTDDTLCVDLGHKAIASENPLNNRVFFLNASDLKPTGHSEEHMVFLVEKKHRYQVGDVFYGIPYHICPTVALHDTAWVVENKQANITWAITSRTRKITV
jgi:D-serine deaminase-like pyridoxal phosphate-dependent protein